MVKTTMIITTLSIKIMIMFVTKEECLVHVDVFMRARLHNWYQTLELLPIHLEIITMSILSWLKKKTIIVININILMLIMIIPISRPPS